MGDFDCKAAGKRLNEKTERFRNFLEKYGGDVEAYKDIEGSDLFYAQKDLEWVERRDAAYAAWSHVQRMEGVMVDRERIRQAAEERRDTAEEKVLQLGEEWEAELEASENLESTDPDESRRHFGLATAVAREMDVAEGERIAAEGALHAAEADLERAEGEYDRALEAWEPYTSEYSERDMNEYSRSRAAADRADANRDLRTAAGRMDTNYMRNVMTEYGKLIHDIADILRKMAAHKCGQPAGVDDNDEGDDNEGDAGDVGEEGDDDELSGSGGAGGGGGGPMDFFDVDDAIAEEMEEEE